MNNSQRYDKLRGRATEEKPIDTSMMYGKGQHFSANATSRDLARMFRLYLPTLRIPDTKQAVNLRQKSSGL